MSVLGRLTSSLGILLCAWLLQGEVTPAAAQAALPAAARVVVSGCSTRFNERTLQDQLRIELLSAGVRSVRSVDLYADDVALEEEPHSLATLRLTFPDCEEAGDEIRLGIADRKSGRHLERALVISDVPLAMQARAIAIALTELLRTEWKELSKEAPKPVQASDQETRLLLTKLRASRMLQEEAAREQRELKNAHRLRLEWLAVGHLYSQTDSGDLSTLMAFSKLFGPRTRVQLGASLAGGAGQGSDARLFQTSGRLLVALCSRTMNPGIEVGGILEAGWANFSGTNEGKKSGALVSAGAHATLRLPAGEAVEALITVQAGYVIVPMSALVYLADSRQRIGFSGPTLGIGVGIATWL